MTAMYEQGDQTEANNYTGGDFPIVTDDKAIPET
jgi:hypothetical protein